MNVISKGLMCVIAALVMAVPVEASKKPQSEIDVFDNLAGIDVDPVAFRIQVRSLARPFSGLLEGTADRILNSARTQEERILALRLKVNGIPAMQSALFIPDPLAALFEAAGLLEQFEIFIIEGQGKTLPDLVRAETEKAIWEMERRIQQLGLAHGVTEEEAAPFWRRAEEWARAHPIVDSFVARETTQILYAEHLENTSGRLRGFGQRLDENIHDLSSRFDLYAEYIAKQARWQAELMVEEGLPRRIVERTGPVPLDITGLPVDLPAERAVVLDALKAERQLLLMWAEAQRNEMQQFLRSERAALAAVASGERETIVKEFRNEREAVLVALDEQRSRVVIDLEGLMSSSVERTGEQLIDHAALRFSQMLGLGMIVFFIGSFIILRYAKVRTPG